MLKKKQSKKSGKNPRWCLTVTELLYVIGLNENSERQMNPNGNIWFFLHKNHGYYYRLWIFKVFCSIFQVPLPKIKSKEKLWNSFHAPHLTMLKKFITRTLRGICVRQLVGSSISMRTLFAIICSFIFEVSHRIRRSFKDTYCLLVLIASHLFFISWMNA